MPSGMLRNYHTRMSKPCIFSEFHLLPSLAIPIGRLPRVTSKLLFISLSDNFIYQKESKRVFLTDIRNAENLI